MSEKPLAERDNLNSLPAAKMVTMVILQVGFPRTPFFFWGFLHICPLHFKKLKYSYPNLHIYNLVLQML